MKKKMEEFIDKLIYRYKKYIKNLENKLSKQCTCNPEENEGCTDCKNYEKKTLH